MIDPPSHESSASNHFTINSQEVEKITQRGKSQACTLQALLVEIRDMGRQSDLIFAVVCLLTSTLYWQTRYA